ncbi:MAG: VOC family protein [Thermomicrobiaceae bacterium]
MKLSHIRLLTNQFTVMFRFYRDALELRVRWGDEDGRYADFDTGTGVDIALFSRKQMAELVDRGEAAATPAAQDAAMLIVAVDDVDFRVNRLVEHGATLVNPPADQPDHGIRSAHLRDPDGNLIELNSELPQSRWSETLKQLNQHANWDQAPDR